MLGYSRAQVGGTGGCGSGSGLIHQPGFIKIMSNNMPIVHNIVSAQMTESLGRDF